MRRLLIIVLLFIICIGAFASPARYGRVMLTQPDGTCFYALFRGDEFIKINQYIPYGRPQFALSRRFIKEVLKDELDKQHSIT